MKKHFILLTFLLLLMAGQLLANGGYEIKVKIEGYEGKELLLAYHYGESQYVKDTVPVNDADYFVFSGEEALEPGFYMVVIPPKNDFFQLLIDDQNQRFSVTTKADNPAQYVKIEGSPENELFYEYLAYLAEKRPVVESLQAEMKAAEGDAGKTAEVQARIDVINEEVTAYQDNLTAQHPKSFTAAIILSGKQLEMPEFKGSDEELQMKQWEYTKAHYFDNLDISDPRMLRTPFLFQRIDYFVNKLQVQHPDTLSKAIDYILKKAEPSEETFKYYLIHFLNAYARSKIVGMDAVYVHLVDKYYAQGKAPWTEEDQLKKILDNANTLRPLLIGKTAPNLKLYKKDGSPVELHDVDAKYTILYFWRYDCGHCKKSTPKMKEFYDAYKDKGVKIMAVCVKPFNEIAGCWEYIEDNEIQDWLHTTDPYSRSRYAQIYDVRSTPQIYVLDQNKEILSKKIDADQLPELMDHLIEMDKKAAEQH
ncbi:MAG: redoxin domain-containing protein [Saprospiraceae bacterium]|nr:redoxin domain-containing protein [Lewinella sp.]